MRAETVGASAETGRRVASGANKAVLVTTGTPAATQDMSNWHRFTPHSD